MEYPSYGLGSGQMNRNIIFLIVFVIIALIGLSFIIPIILPFSTSGFGGISSNVQSLDNSYADASQYTYSGSITSYGAFMDFTSSTTMFFPCDLRLELGQPSFKGRITDYSKTITVEGDDAKITRTYEVSIASFQMGLSFRTSGRGIGPVMDSTFWIEVTENAYSVFEDADAVEAYILEVVTIKPAEYGFIQLADVTPSAGGFKFDLESLSNDHVPQWILDSGYQGVISQFKDVRFPVVINRLGPYYDVITRAENQVSLFLELRVLCFGFWEVVAPYDPWVPGAIWQGYFPWLNDLFLGLQLIIGAIFGLIVTVAVVRIPVHPIIKVIALGILWVAVFVAFGGVALFAGT